MSKRLNILFLTGLLIVLSACTNEDFESPWMELDTDDSIIALSDTFFLDENTGFVTRGFIPEPYQPVLLKTVNGGSSWVTKNLRPPTVSGFGQFFPLGGNIIYTIGIPYDSIAIPNAVSFLYKSIDGGESWNIVVGDFYKNPGNIFFWDESNGMVCGNGIFKTNDGGATWREILNTDNISFFGVGSILFTSGYVGFVSGGAKFDGTNFGIIAASQRVRHSN